MQIIKIVLASALVASATLTMTAVGDFGSANAKAHAKKGKPGKCGVNYYYDKKKRLCVNATLKK